MRAFYADLRAASQQTLDGLSRTFNRVSWYRFFAFALGAMGTIFAFSLRSYGWGAAAVAGFAAFLLLVRRHTAIVADQQVEQARLCALEQYLARFDGGWRAFEETGERYLSEDFPPGRDLDLFGANSLYQFLCVARTNRGRDRLAAALQNGAPHADDIARRQQAVRELGEKQTFSLHMQALLGLHEEKRRTGKAEELQGLMDAARGTQPGVNRLLRALMWVLPVVTLFFFLSAAAGVQPAYNAALGLCGILAQMLCAALGYVRNTRLLAPVLAFADRAAAWSGLLGALEHETFSAPLLVELQQTLRQSGGASRGLAELARVCAMARVKLNGIAYLMLLSVAMWDYHCAARFCAWRSVHGSRLADWLDALGAFEELLSLAVLCNVRAQTCFPAIEAGGGPLLEAEELGHPLLPEEACVGNSVRLTPGACLITGSNMSGKTTFLRAVGINLILAYAGGPAAAKRLCAGEMAVLSSIRAEDSVTGGVSSFYAELLRIRRMVEAGKEKRPMLALIDEIYKGTNSRDRAAGAVATLRRLATEHAILLVTTHDTELCGLEHEPGVRAVNYHFEESYKGDAIRFDYRLRPGPATSTNARFLLKMTGILE